MSGRVCFVGAGPGAADLLTLRAARVLGEADIVVWARSLVDPEILQHARPQAELVASDDKTFDDVLAIYRRAAAEGLDVARVHSGDPTLYGTLHEQLGACRALGLECEIVPGVSSLVRRGRRARAGADDPRRQPVADPHPPRAAHLDAAERGAGRDGRARHDDGAVPVRAAPARAAGRPDRRRLRARHALRRRLQGELAGRDRHPLPAGRAGRRASARRRSRRRRSCSSAPRSAAARAPASRTSTTPATATATARSARPDRYREACLSDPRPRRLRRRACRPGPRRCSRRADVVAGGRAVLARARAAAARARRARARASTQTLRDAARRARRRRACSRRATRASSASSARCPRGRPTAGRAPRAVVGRARVRAARRSRGTTRSSSPPTAATRGPRSTPRCATRRSRSSPSPATPPTIVAALAGPAASTVAEALGTPDERLARRAAVRRAQRRDRAEPGDARVWPPRTPTRWALPEDAFEHRAGMITKAEVRAVALAALGPGTGDLRVGRRLRQRLGRDRVRAPRRRRRSRSTSDPDAIALDDAQRRRPRRAGRAPSSAPRPAALRDLPEPDAVFVGGGGARCPPSSTTSPRAPAARSS